MATTTNYGWTTPDDTALVKDGASAIRTLGSSVDTTTKNLNPETTLGDIAYRSSTSNVNTRLGIGTSGQVLTVAAGVPSWATPSDQTPLTTKGDLFTFSTLDARLGVGANNTVLTADSAEATGLKWAAPASGGFTFQTWSPSYTNLTIGNGTVTARYGTSGKFTYFEWTLTFGSTTSISGSPEITLPTTPKNTGYNMWQGNIGYLDAGTNIYFGHLTIAAATSKVILWVDRANGTYLEYAGIDATTPFTWTTNDRISLSGQYEEA